MLVIFSLCFKLASLLILLKYAFAHALLAATLAPIVVTAQKPPADLSSDKVTAKEIRDKQFERVSDAIVQMPGIFVAQSGSLGQQTSVFIRGGNSDHTSVIVDGMNALDPATGTFNFAGLGTEGSSVVAVSRGVSVAEGKADALSGAIEIETRRGQNSINDTFKFDTKLEGGSHDTYSIESGVEGQAEKVDCHIRVVHDASKGTVTTPKRFQTAPRQSKPDPSDRSGLVARTGMQLNENWRLNLWNRIQKADEYSYSPVTKNPAQQGVTKLNFHRAEIETNVKDYTQKVGYSFAVTERLNKSAYAPYDPSVITKGRIDSVYLKNELQLTKQYVLLTHLTNERQERFSQKQFESPVNNRVIHQTVGVGQKITPINAWRIDLWGRWHHYTAFKHYYSTKAKTSYAITKTGTTVMASYGTGVRAPSLSQLYDASSGNSNLKPEQSKGYDVGIEQDVIEKRMCVGATYFKQNFDNLIVPVSVAPFTWQSQNVNKAKTYGVESFVEAKLGEWDSFFDQKSKVKPPITIRLEHTFLHAKDISNNRQLKRRPMHKLAVNGMWHVTESVLLGAGLVHYGKRSDVDRVKYNQIYRSGPTVLRIFSSYCMSKQVEFFGRIENAGNSQAEYPEGYAMPGFSVYSGVKFKY